MTGEDTHFIGRIYGRLAELWPTTETLTDLYQGFRRQSERTLGEWVTLAKKNGNAAFVPQLWSRIANLLPRNGGGGDTAGPRRKEAGGQHRSDQTTPE